MCKNVSRCFFVGAFVLLAMLVGTSAFAAPLPLYGPKKFERTKGAPVAIDEKITLCAGRSGTFRLTVENGDASGASRISSGTIKINGTDAIKQNEFSQQVGRIEKTVTLNTDNTLSVSLASGPTALVNVSLQCLSKCLDVRITEPATGATLKTPYPLVRGNITNVIGDVGVVLKTYLASSVDIGALVPGKVYGSNFGGKARIAANDIVVKAIVTDSCGNQAADTITVNGIPSAFVEMSARPDSGVYRSNGAFVTTLEADARISAAITNYEWDTNGDNVIDISGKDYSSIAASYTQSGLYFPKVIVTDSAGNKYSDTMVVSVMSVSEADAIIKANWEGMKSSLAVGDIDRATGYFLPQSQEQYKGMFTAIKNDLPQMLSEMNASAMEFIEMKNGYAQYRIKRSEPAGLITYYITFGLDENGIWKINQF